MNAQKKLAMQERTAIQSDLTLAYRWKVGNMYPNSDVSKNILSQFFESAKLLKRKTMLLNAQVCQKCFALFTSDDHITRFRPKRKVTNFYVKALRKMALPGRVQPRYRKAGLKLLQSNTLKKTKCLSCGHTNKFKGVAYSDLLQTRTERPKTKTKENRVTPKKAKNTSSNSNGKMGKKNTATKKNDKTELQSFLDSL